jgi:hypothetical protein
LWPEIVEQAREQKRMVGEALEAATPVSWQGAVIELETAPGQEFLVEQALGRNGAMIVEILGSRLGKVATIKLLKGARPDEGKAQPVNDLRSSELERIRRLDKALDVAATELDLEIVDERLPRSPKGS